MAQGVEIQAGDEGVEKPHRVFGADVILQRFGEQQRLLAGQTGAMVHHCE